MFCFYVSICLTYFLADNITQNGSYYIKSARCMFILYDDENFALMLIFKLVI